MRVLPLCLMLSGLMVPMPALAEATRTYTDPSTQISLDVPASWHVGPDACEAYTTNFRAPDWPQGVMMSVTWSPAVLPPQLQAAIHNLIPRPNGSEQQWTWANQAGTRFVMEPAGDERDSDPYQSVTYETLHNGHQVIVAGRAPRGIFKRFLPAFDAAVTGVHWTRANELAAVASWHYRGDGVSLVCPPGWRSSEPGLSGCDPALIYQSTTTLATLRVNVRTGRWEDEYASLLYQFEGDQIDKVSRDVRLIIAGHPATGIVLELQRACRLEFVTNTKERFLHVTLSSVSSEPRAAIEQRLEAIMQSATWQ
ncbi:MAG: hypothetical protein JWM80_3309 [Cyanobacteria bacterium RYN_339]|nr:hypothetical protein [Cyanobacteria bacterium RYN_339]